MGYAAKSTFSFVNFKLLSSNRMKRGQHQSEIQLRSFHLNGLTFCVSLITATEVWTTLHDLRFDLIWFDWGDKVNSAHRNYNKILQPDWLSAGPILAFIAQFTHHAWWYCTVCVICTLFCRTDVLERFPSLVDLVDSSTSFTRQNVLKLKPFFSNFVIAMINWKQNLASSNLASLCVTLVIKLIN